MTFGATLMIAIARHMDVELTDVDEYEEPYGYDINLDSFLHLDFPLKDPM